MKPVHSTIAMLSVMWAWNDFLMPLLLLTKSENQTLQLSQYVFQLQFSTDYNLAEDTVLKYYAIPTDGITMPTLDYFRRDCRHGKGII
jgi:ABC-type glycerol-3-phosphate transport system permease component